ncbi:MAG: protein-glutamate O-methyltransferase CheR, partial [Deltaproteobacteria bacterium]|nr:protein-glutamate O-methyltransferase CheR [Deltaproteobacteria bacterium]
MATIGSVMELPSAEEVAEGLARVLELLRRRTGHDFHRYRRQTIQRRVRHRLLCCQQPGMEDYLRLLESDPREPEALVQDLLISVTSFFRDPEAFAYLAEHVLPRLLHDKGPEEPLRIWVPGCATGEEAYTLAMLVQEKLAGLASPPPVQIFATDIDREALQEARQGRFEAGLVEALSPERLGAFFVGDGRVYQVASRLREICVFSAHNLIRDP